MKSNSELQFGDSVMFRNVLKNPEIFKGILEIVLNEDINKIKHAGGQNNEDIYCTPNDEKINIYVNEYSRSVYSTGILQKDDGSIPKRTRYYQAINELAFSQSCNGNYSCDKNYVILFCRFDPFGYGLQEYVFRNMCNEDSGLQLGDNATTIILNTTGAEEPVSDRLIELLGYIEHPEKVPEKPLYRNIENEVTKARKKSKN